MRKFVKRNTVVEVDIMGKCFSVDFGRDCILPAIEGLTVEMEEIQKKHSGETDRKKRTKAVNEEEKQAFQNAINTLLGDETGAERIFKEDNSAFYHGEVYGFLVDEYTAFMKATPEYVPERADAK